MSCQLQFILELSTGGICDSFVIQTATSLARDKTEKNYPGNFRELIAFCLHRKNLETLLFRRDALMGERKYSRNSEYVFQDCGASKPCRLYGFQ
jgi:hypothetical protein